MPNKHGNSKSDTIVERTLGMDDPFIQRYKLREGWKVVYRSLLDNKNIRFFIDNIEYYVYRSLNIIRLKNQKTKKIKDFLPADIEDLCRVIITSNKWEVIS